MFDRYEFKLTFLRPVLATNPCDPAVMDTHILERQRKLIQEKSKVNSQINKYLEQIPISKEKGDEELNKLLDGLEKLIGFKLSPEDRANAIAGKLESLKESLNELELKGTTVFFWDKEKNLPCIGDHMIYGFMKAAGEALARTKERKNATMLQSISYTQSIINQHVRCDQRFITFDKDIMRKEDGSPLYLQRSLRAETAQGPRISLAKSEQVDAGAKIQFSLKILKDSPLTQEILTTIFQYGEFTGLGQWRNSGFGEFTFEMMKTK